MPNPLTPEQVRRLEMRLREERRAALAKIREVLEATDEQRYIDLAGQVHDKGEEAVADLLYDLELAEIDQLVHEVRDIERALNRIMTGEYGICTDCGAPIGYERLSAYPTAKRCLDCQRRYETERAQTSPSL